MVLHLRSIMAIAFGILGICPIASAGSADDPTGVWLTEKQDARIQVGHCGSGICGKVISLRAPLDPNTGRPQLDDKNPDPRLATRPIVGLHLFSGMRPVAPGKWTGVIYNADDGKSYASNVTLLDPTTLRVEGCVGPFCGGETWSRSR